MRTENKELRDQVSDLKQSVKASRTSSNARSDTKTTLVIGDSLIKSLDESKMQNVTVKSHSGATLTDITMRLKESKSNYDKLIICAGTNDCSKSTFNCLEAADQYRQMIVAAKTKTQELTISSVPPRTDKNQNVERVKALNACLCTIAMDTEVNFADNDPSFTLKDGSANDGYLQQDGLHLNRQGTNRLAHNLGLTDNPKQDVCKAWKAAAPRTAATRLDSGQQAAGRCTSSNRPARKDGRTDGRKWNDVARTTPATQLRSEQPASRESWCYNCGEENHVRDRCRYSTPIECHQCHQMGHKFKYCEYYSQ